MDEQIISQEGYDKLKNELDYLSTLKRREIADRIQKAKDMGDLSENAEYADAKESQAFNESRISEINALLKNLTVVKNGGSEGTVSMGSKITIKSELGQKEYTIVSFNEVDPMAGKISNESPIGRAFIGKKSGATVAVKTPKGIIEYKIIKVE